MYKLIYLSVFIMSSIMSASTMFSLSGVKKVYPVVEISSKLVTPEYKALALEEIKTTTQELNIDTSGYDTTSLALLVNQKQINDLTIINMRLLIGETVLRHSNKKDVFAITYDNKQSFVLNDVDELEDKFEDALSMLLSTFSEQYEEENKKKQQVKITDDNFALHLNYETNYDDAIKKAKLAHKNILLILVSNYCPWCRKFEKRVLADSIVNEIIQDKYIPLILNKEKDAFPKEFNSSFTPIVNFIDYKTLKSYKQIVGYNNKDEFKYFITKDTGKK